MTNDFSIIYQDGMTPRMLAQTVLEDIYGKDNPLIPIDPFKLMRMYGIVYQFMEFKDLEGIYLMPEDEKDVAIVGINKKRPITRQRFSAAHELCHHLKDRDNETCPIGARNEVETFAEQFAAELLMPFHIFKTEADKYAVRGKISFDNALMLAEKFGVSFNSCVRRLAYVFHMIDCPYGNLNKLIAKYKPNKKKEKLGIDTESITLVRQAVDSYVFFFVVEKNLVWYRFKNDFIYNENRMEGLDLDEEEVAEIVTDLRLNRQESVYCKEKYEDLIQVLGHAELYDYVLGTQDQLTIYKILDINRMLFQFAPFPEESGKTRTDNNLVLGTKFETVDWTRVAMELYKLQVPVEDLMAHANDLTISEYVLECMKIHHRITQIHPFRDGNGRSSRALLNWMLRLKGLPPIYFKTTDKESYYKALEKADQDGDYTELLRVTIRELYRTITRTMIDAEPQ